MGIDGIEVKGMKQLIVFLGTCLYAFGLQAQADPDTTIRQQLRTLPFWQDDKAIFIALGEFHTEKGYHHKFALLKELHSQYGFRHLIYEQPVPFEKLIEQYMEGSDSSYFRLNRWSLGSEEDRILLPMIRNYNSSLPDSQKIRIHCVDIPGAVFSESADALRISFQGRKDIRKQLPLMYRKLVKHNYWVLKSRRRGRQIIRKLLKDLEKNRAHYKNILKDDFLFYERSLASVMLAMSYSRNQWRILDFGATREDFIVSGIQTVAKTVPNTRMVAFYGNTHVNKQQGMDTVPAEKHTLMNVLSRDTSLHTLSICTEYLDMPYYVTDDYQTISETDSNAYRILKQQLGEKEFVIVDVRKEGLPPSAVNYSDWLLVKRSDMYPAYHTTYKFMYQKVQLKSQKRHKD